MLARSLALLIACLLAGCSHLERVNQHARQAPGNCQDHVRAVAVALAGQYEVRGLRTNDRWTGPHISALVTTPDGLMVLDNGALWRDRVFPLAELGIPYRIVPVPE